MAIILEDVLKKKCRILWVSLAILMVLPPCREAMYIEGELLTDENWVFMGRFCFLSEIGRLRFEVQYPTAFAVENFVLYYDEPDQWPAVYPLDTAPMQTCKEKESVLKPENHQVINLTTDYVWSGCIVQKSEDSNDNDIENFGQVQEVFDCRAGRSFRSARERWWYVALDNCETTNGMFLKYKMTFTNGESWWYKHFSADQFGILQTDLVFVCLFGILLFFSLLTACILQTDIVFICLYGILFMLSMYVAYVLKERQLFHTTYKMFMVVIILYVFSLLLLIIHYVDFANDGVANNDTKLVAQITLAFADATFLLMLILMAKGYTITRGRISHSGSIKIAVLMCLYAMLFTALFIYQQVVFDPGEVLYLYESPAGFGLIALRGICWLWFIYAIFFTLKHYPEKGMFYYPFFFFYTIWFLATPIMILIATFVMPKWWREKIMNFIELLIAFTAQLVFLILTRPSAANSNFPYHVRTSQIGIMTEPNGNLSNNIDNFSHHAYGHHAMEGGGLGHSPNFTELFSVSGSNNKPQGSNGTSSASSAHAFTASSFQPPSFSRGNGSGSETLTWPSLPPLAAGHLPPIRNQPAAGEEPPPYPAIHTGTTRDVSAMFAADGYPSPREMGGLFAPQSDSASGNGSSGSSNSLIKTDKTSSFMETPA